MVQLLLIEKEVVTIPKQIEFVISGPQTQTARVIYTQMTLYFKTLQSLIVFLFASPQLR